MRGLLIQVAENGGKVEGGGSVRDEDVGRTQAVRIRRDLSGDPPASFHNDVRGDSVSKHHLDRACTAVSIVVDGRRFWLFALADAPPYILYTYLIYYIHTLYIIYTLYVYIQLYTYLAGRPQCRNPARQQLWPCVCWI